ncbi:hypothetical protein IFM89_024446 [Coptis chinensis]|uniref:Late embryogenesis abundant protein LEA-2 subgroup domain-containing protein n=1 Tax=Coptis chinensis TaxID=261450 RepID=A0A835HFB6_9MAGN|nr:hypothetical protein IFM89_024446 [Coptis chinensis]
MANQKIENVEDEEALFNSYHCPVLYYVQSPSTISHANSNECRNSDSTVLSPYRTENFITTRPSNPNHDVARFILSRYSSHGSNNTFLHEKKISYDLQSHETGATTENGALLRMCGSEEHKDVANDHVEQEVDDDDDYGIEWKGRSKGCWRFFSFDTSSTCCWFFLQLSWRFMVSLGVALLVFFLATNPPPPIIMTKVARIPQFALAEGVDQSGVTTKILTCNCSLNLYVDNKSKLFGLHIRPSTIQMSFGPVVFATTQDPKLYAESHGSSIFTLYVGTKNKAMYGAGRSMQDMLESGEGLPLIVRFRLSTNFKVVWNLINPKFHHNVECMLVLHKKHYNKAFRSSCKVSSKS